MFAYGRRAKRQGEQLAAAAGAEAAAATVPEDRHELAAAARTTGHVQETDFFGPG